MATPTPVIDAPIDLHALTESRQPKYDPEVVRLVEQAAKQPLRTFKSLDDFFAFLDQD